MIAALRVRGAAYLLATALIGRLPTGMSALAIVRLVRDQGGDFGTASLLTAVYVVLGTVGQPLLSRAIDRTGRARPILVGSAAISTLAFVGLAELAVTLPIVGVAFAAVAGLFTPPLESCLRSLWSRMMQPGTQLHAAFSVDAAAQELMFVAAPLLTALGILVFGVKGNVVFLAGLGLIGALAFALNGRLARGPAVAPPHDTRHGSPLSSAPFVRVTIALAAMGVPIGVLTISATGFGELAHVPSASAWGLAANAAGAMTGALIIAHRPFAAPPSRAIRRVGIALAVLYLPTAFVQLPIAAWLPIAFVAGLSLPPLLTQVFAQTPRIVPDTQLNEANAWVISAFTLGIAAGTLLAGYVAAALPGGAGLGLAVVLSSAIALLGALAADPSKLGADS
jgi:MFS family permease